jgi:uncharacterized membrane protein
MPAEAAPEAPAQTPTSAAPDAPAPPSPLAALYHAHKNLIWAVGIAAPLLIVGLGWWLRPDIFYDRFIWEHLWGSAVADTTQRGQAVHNGIAVTDDYTLVSEAVYGIILAVSLYGIYTHVIKRFGVVIDAWFVGAILPFILFGPVTRTLEDTSMFCKAGTLGANGCVPGAFAVWFVSPYLYAQIAVYVLLFMVVGAVLDRRGAAFRDRLGVMAGLLGLAAALYGLAWSLLRSETIAMAHPLVVVGSCAVGLGAFALLQRRGARAVDSALFAGGLAFLLPGLWMIGQWLTGGRWASTFGDRLYVEATGWVLGLPLLACLVVFAAGRMGKRLDPRLAAYVVPLNLGLLYGHMLDGFASFIAICSNALGPCTGAMVFGLSLPSYGEKHPVSNALLGFGNGWVFPLIKLVLVLVIIWVLDVEYQKDLQKERNLSGLVKMAILVLGLAPGLRDYLRLAMGT